MKVLFKYPLVEICLFYLLFRTIHLTLLPIYNDEAIYIDWGYRATHVPGFLYYSLYDAKQPLMIWLFGIFGSFIHDPLFAARLTSVFIGLLTVVGIWKLSTLVFTKKIALLSTILYTVIPIFTLFDRQALLESGVTASGVWSIYFLTRVLKEKTTKYAIFLGISLGMGLFVKTTAVLFLLTSLGILSYHLYHSRQKIYTKLIGQVLAMVTLCTILLIINPQFWQMLPSNSRYVFTLSELFHFPFVSWFTNIIAAFQISFIFVTPIVFCFSVGGMYYLIRKKENLHIIVWFVFPLLLQILTVKNPSQRYIVSLLPLVTIFCSLFIFKTVRLRKLRYAIIFVLIIFPLLFSLLQIFNPKQYFQLSSRITPYAEKGYIEGYVSGYGIPETKTFLEDVAKKEKIIVAYAENTGNPESAIVVYFQNKPIRSAYFEAKYLGNLLEGKDCIRLKSGHNVYYVARNEQQAGLEKYLTKVKTIPKLDNTNTIGIYKLKSECSNPLIVELNFNKH